MEDKIITMVSSSQMDPWLTIFTTLNLILFLGITVLTIMFLIHGIKAFKRSKDISNKLDKIIYLLDKEK